MINTADGCGIVILAAGASSRLGQPKQLLPYHEQTLLEHSITIALASVATQVVLVLGAGAAGIQPVIKDDKLALIVNKQWQEGMASSIRFGLNQLLQQNAGMQMVIFMVCDQPYVSTELLNNLVTLQQQTGRSIVASQYAATTGIPALFTKALFPELLQLKGDAGAKKLVMLHQADTVTIPFPLGSIDIDTAADYQALQKMKNEK